MVKIMFKIIVSISLILLTLTELYAAEYMLKFPDIGIKYKWNNIEKKPVITGFWENSSAQRAGVQINDRIVFSGKSASNDRIFMHGMWDLPIGKKVKTLIYRGDKIKVVHIEVGYYNTIAYYNINLVKKELSFNSYDPILLRGLYSDGLARYALIKSNFVAEIVRVSKFEKDPNDACEEILNSFYVLYDQSKKSNKQLHKDIYSLLNLKFYEYLAGVVKKYSKLEEKDILESENRKKVVAFMKQIFDMYYLPNYSDIPFIRTTYNQINSFSTKIAEEKQAILTDIQKKYQKSKDGWRFLKWGMSVEEAKVLLNSNNSNMTKENDDPVSLILLDGDFIQTDLVKLYSDNDGSLYFYKGKLMGRYLGIGFQYYIDNHEFIAKKLKEKYQKGTIYKKEGPGLGGYQYNHFKLTTKNMNIFTLLVPPRYAGGGIYYYDPKAIRSIISEIKQGHQKAKQDQEKEIEDKF